MSVKNGLFFIAGGGVGSLVTAYCLKKYYEKRAEEEIRSVKESLARYEAKRSAQQENDTPSKEFEEPEFDMGDVNTVDAMEYAKILARERYTSSEDDMDEHKEKPYVIAPKDFGENEEYTKISLLYTADGVVVDEDYQALEHPNSCIGLDSLEHFGEYEEDSVHVRNDRLKCDYEILIDPRTYDEIRKEHR